MAIQISLDSPNYLDHPITSSVQLIENFSIDNFLFQVNNTLNSKDKLGINEPLIFECKVINKPQPGGGLSNLRAKHFSDLSEFLKRKSGLLDPFPIQQKYPEFKNGCFLICLSLALSYTNPKRSIVHKNSHLTKRFMN